MLPLLLVALCVQIILVQADPHYSIIAPHTLHSNSTYEFVIVTHDITADAQIVVGIRGEHFSEKMKLTLRPMHPLFAKITIPVLKNGTYQFFAEGITGINFASNRTLRLDYNQPHIYLQTDKATYKPGDLMRFRVLFLDGSTRPTAVAEAVTIYITDGQKNRIQRYANVVPEKGVFKGELQLGEYPVYGDYAISVLLNDQETASKTFRVQEYVLPKFLVEINAPKKVLASDESFRITIEARYTFGKPVRGVAHISIAPEAHGDDQVSALVVKQVAIDKKQFVTFDMKELLLPKGTLPHQNNFVITAQVVEDSTENIQNTTANIMVVRDRYNIVMPDMECFHSGERITYPITVTDIDDRPITGTNKYLILEAYNTADDVGRLEVQLKGNGTMFIDLNCPEYGDMRLTARYNEQIGSGQLIKIDVGLYMKDKKQKIGQPTMIEINADESMPYLVCTIFGHEKILDSRILTTDGSHALFHITPTADMLPRAKIYIYYIKNNIFKMFQGDIEFDETLGNKISISGPATVEPGDNVTLTVNTETGSYVALLAIDQSVSLLRTGNDFNGQDMLDDIAANTDQKVVIMTSATINKLDAAPAAVEIVARSGSKISHLPKKPRIRKNFPETWFFDDIVSTTDKSFNITRQIPDTITSWFITGFSLNPSSGLALTSDPTAITVFRPFFIATNLPYSVKKGEVLSVPIIVFNYFNQTLQVAVTLEAENDEFEFVNSQYNTPDCKKFSNVEAQSSVMVLYQIRPLRTGYITLKMQAISLAGGDAMHKQLKVVPEGSTVFKSSSHYINAEESFEIDLEIPEDIIPDSEFIEVSATGFIMSATLDTVDDPAKFDKLVSMPKGCGEQNMITMLPSILLLHYMESIGKSDKAIVKKAKQYMQQGYQRQLGYKHKDGSFSAFGWKDKSGSTRLTAYVIRGLQQASKYIQTDQRVLDSGYRFLEKHQMPNGSFSEPGRVIDFARLNDVGLTAYVLLTFLDNEAMAAKYSHVVERGFRYILQEIGTTEDMYALAVAAYALKLRKHKDEAVSAQIWTKLRNQATISGDHMSWSKTYSRRNWKGKTVKKSQDVEVTSYVLMALLGTNEPVLPIIKWLLTKRNAYGGFPSSQDTAVALQALTQYADYNKHEGANIVVRVFAEQEKLGNFRVNRGNGMVLQKLPLPGKTRKLKFNAIGTGQVILQISYHYNMYIQDETPAFQITTAPKVNGSRLSLDITTEYFVPENVVCKQSNMALIEVSLPSGYTATRDVFDIVNRVPEVNRIETENQDTKVIIYFNSLLALQKYDISVLAERSYDVAEQKPAEVRMYDYYDSEQCGYDYYKVENAAEEMCEGRVCLASC